MKKEITVKEFKELLKADGWEHKQRHGLCGEYAYEKDEDGDIEDGDIIGNIYIGVVEIESTLKLDDYDRDIVVVFKGRFKYDTHTKFHNDSHWELSAGEPPWEIDGISVVDEDDNEFDPDLTTELLEPYNSPFETIDWDLVKSDPSRRTGCYMAISIIKQGKRIEQKILELNADANVRYSNGTILILINYISNAGFEELLSFCQRFDTHICQKLRDIRPYIYNCMSTNEYDDFLQHQMYDHLAQASGLTEIQVFIWRR